MTNEELHQRILDLDDEAYTAGQIALALGVSVEETLDIISRRVRRPDGVEQAKQQSLCQECGGFVFKPCLLCRQRRIGKVPPAQLGTGPLPGDLTVDEIYRRARELRAKRKEPKPKRGPSGIREYWLNDILPDRKLGSQ